MSRHGFAPQLVATALVLTTSLVGACSNPSSGTGGGGVPGGSGGMTGSGGELAAAGGRTGIGGAAGTGGIGSGGSGSGGMGASGGTNGAGGASSMHAALVNTYDGSRQTTVSFDAAWRFHLGDVSGAQAATFDDSSWTGLDVPHDWSISLPFNQSSAAGPGGGYLDGGLGWYRKTFTLPSSSSGQKIIVQFDGVYMDSTVWLNGTQVGARPYGFSSSWSTPMPTASSFSSTTSHRARRR